MDKPVKKTFLDEILAYAPGYDSFKLATHVSEILHWEGEVKEVATIRERWIPRKRNDKHDLTKAFSQRSTEYSATTFPWIHQILRHFSEQNEFDASAILALIRYRFLRDAYEVALYSPNAPNHRFSKIFDWIYFPDHFSIERRNEFKRICLIAVLDGDVQIYGHLSTLTDRFLENPIHKPLIEDFIPEFALATTLSGDYLAAREICDRALKSRPTFPTGTLAERQEQRRRMELECLMADADGQMSVPTSMSACDRTGAHLVSAIQEHDLAVKRFRDSAAEEDSLLRMAYCGYIRSAIRTCMHLRNVGVRYELPTEIELHISNYRKLTLKCEARYLEGKLTTLRVNDSLRFLGLDFDTLSRSYAFLRTESITLAFFRPKPDVKSVVKPDVNPEIKSDVKPATILKDKASIDEIHSLLQQATQFAAKSEHYFKLGDASDRSFFLQYRRTLCPNVDEKDIPCDRLSGYRINSTRALLHYALALYARRPSDLEDNLEKAKEAREDIEKSVTPERMKHSRILSERLSNMLNDVANKQGLDWVSKNI
jgi:hypothetical protein